MIWIKEINKCWNEEKTPDEWNGSIICHVLKKFDKIYCRNYKRISLMLYIAKIYERILERKQVDSGRQIGRE